MFRPINSSESNIFTIRASIGFGSSLGAFNSTGLTNTTTYTIASSTGAGVSGTFKDYLSSPSYTNLPSGFYINYLFNTTLTTTNNLFTITYGKAFTSQPSITVTPCVGAGSLGVLPTINRTSLTSATLAFQTGAATTPLAISSDGALGVLGFDIVISGPVKVGVNTGNSNKGWSFNDTTTADPSLVYTSLDVNLGGTTAVANSIVVAKNLKLMGADNTIKTYTTSTSTLDYTQPVWLISNSAASTTVTLSTVTPQVGMFLIVTNISSASAANAAITCGGTYIVTPSATTPVLRTTATLQPGGTITLYGVTVTSFYVVSSNGASFT